MLVFLSELAYWHWLLLGIALMSMEMLLPAAMIFMWPGIAALMIGVMMAFVPHLMPLYQIGLWLILSLVFITEWIKYCQGHPPKPVVRRNTRLPGEELIGQQFTLQKAIIYGRGELEVNEKLYPVLAIDDYPAGTLVKVARVEGAALRVQQII